MHRFCCVWLRRACFCFSAVSRCTKTHNAFLPSTIGGHRVVSRMGLSSTEPQRRVSCPSLEHTCTRFPCAFTERCACSFGRYCLAGLQKVSPMLTFKASFYSVGPKTKHIYYIELRLPMGSTMGGHQAKRLQACSTFSSDNSCCPEEQINLRNLDSLQNPQTIPISSGRKSHSSPKAAHITA